MGRPRILVIDDEREVRDAIADVLRSDGHDVQTARDGRDGLDRISQHPFDLVFCDLRMPELDGRAFYDQVRSDHPQTLKRIVFVTAQAQGPEYGPFLRETGAPVRQAVHDSPTPAHR